MRVWNPSQRINEADWVGLRNYIGLLGDASFRDSFFVTLKFAFFVVGIEMVAGVGLALLLDRNLRGMSALRTIFIWPMMIAPIVVGLMGRYMYHPSVGVFKPRVEGDRARPGTMAVRFLVVAHLGDHCRHLAVDVIHLHSGFGGTAVAAAFGAGSGWH